MDYYVPKGLSPDKFRTTVKSGFGMCKNEANLDQSRNSISTCDKLANAWTESKQGMSKFPMNDKNMFNSHMEVNEPQKPGVYPTTVGINSKNLKGG